MPQNLTFLTWILGKNSREGPSPFQIFHPYKAFMKVDRQKEGMHSGQSGFGGQIRGYRREVCVNLCVPIRAYEVAHITYERPIMHTCAMNTHTT